jgi:hypothetical protein
VSFVLSAVRGCFLVLGLVRVLVCSKTGRSETGFRCSRVPDYLLCAIDGPRSGGIGQSISNLWRLGELKAGGGIFQKGKVMEEKGKKTEDRRQEEKGPLE